ncbi:MAG: helix-turn-helix transcriptional regulator [Gammaproteobacteria bacterium]
MNGIEFHDSITELIAAATYPNHNDRIFAETMFRVLKHFVDFDSACINLCEVEKGYRLPQLKSYFHRQPNEMATNYQKTSYTDNFSPHLLVCTGTAFEGLARLDPDEFAESPFYFKHCHQFNVENALAVAGGLPGHLHRYFVLYLFSSLPKKRFSIGEIEHMNQLFPILFSAWQYRLGLICRETMSNRIMLLQQFAHKPRLLELIRLIVQNPLAPSKEYAREMNCSERTVEHQLSALFDQMQINGYYKNKKIEIFRRFQFLNP